MDFSCYHQSQVDNLPSFPEFSNSNGISDGKQRRCRHMLLGSVGPILLIGIFLLVLFSDQSRILNDSTDGHSSLKITVAQPIKVAAYNKYTLRDGPAGADYGWLEGHLLAEPYKTTYFSIISAESNYEYESKLVNSKTGDIEATFSTTKFSHLFEDLQDRKLVISLYQNHQGKRELAETSSHKIYVRYVRREIRNLFEDDLEELLDTMKILWDVEQSAGREQYGDGYQNVIEMVKIHLKYAVASDCDHFHDGYGFITQHLALTNFFEQSLQAVNPRVCLPYWDYVKDFQTNLLENGDDYTNFDNEGLFTTKYFGGTEVSTGKIKDGRWEGLEVPYFWEAGLTDEDLAEIPSNAYGHLRAPWSNNPVKYVQRSTKTCGVDTSIGYVGPTCETISDLQSLDTLEEYLEYISYRPHGPTHTQVGGTFNCEDAYNSLAHYFPDKKSHDVLKAKAYKYHEGAYGVGFLDCATENKRCYCPDEENLKAAEDICDTFGSLVEYSECDSENMPRQYLEDFVAVVCNSGLVEGDNAQASSSYTPEFWVIHPEVERFVLKKRVISDFESMDWPEGYSWIDGDECSGHGKDDIVLMGTARFRTAQGENIMPTNAEMLALLSTYESTLPYIYDNLKWDFCSSLGYNV
mmetsp:Transcript_3324/g.4271  ORF Transcript_3324/g.4271 Transcript_3324/m.4271 type:complete len:635 (-) Transcript_3324:139-2043(-)